MNIKQIEEALKNEDASPPDLAKFQTILAGWYSFYGQMLKRIEKMVTAINRRLYVDNVAAKNQY